MISDVQEVPVPNLRELRRRRLLTQKELADRLGVRYQTVQLWESGQRYPRPSAQRRLCEALEVTPEDLLAALDQSAEEGKAAA